MIVSIHSTCKAFFSVLFGVCVAVPENSFVLGRCTGGALMPPTGPSKGDLVTKFVTYFYQHIRNASVPDIHTMYMTTFKKISDDYFKTSPWPYYTELKHHVNDELFWILYQVCFARSRRF